MRLVAVDTEIPFPNLKVATDTVCFAWVNSSDHPAISGWALGAIRAADSATVSSVTVALMSLKGKTMFISGASRGIGLAIAKRAAQDGANIALVAKTAEPHPKLPGTVYTAAKEIEEAGGQALPIVGDVRDPDSVESAVANAVEQFGGIDICVNNASAINLGSISEVPMKRFDLMNGIQVRGTYAVSQACIPHMKGRENPHILTLSPPVLLGKEWLKPTAYMMAKFGMTLCALGIAEELREDGIASNTLWPRTLVATAAVQNLLGGDEAMGRARKPEIYSDAAYVILNKPSREYTGNTALCEDVLLDSGVSDLSTYNCVPGGTLGVDFWVDGVNPPGYSGP
jgi:citronellol/citronellal dehydrogenase